jgi:hypothetical protein
MARQHKAGVKRQSENDFDPFFRVASLKLQVCVPQIVLERQTSNSNADESDGKTPR